MIFALSLLRTLSSLMVSVAFLMLGNSIFTTLLALRAKIEGYPNTLVGLMMSGYFLGFALGTFRSGPLINRVGHIRAFSALAAIASICALFVLLINNAWAWVGLRVVMGAAMAGLFIVVESWLNNRATNESRGVLMSIYIMIGYAASALGQQSLSFGNPGGSELFLLVGMLLSLSLVPVALTRATHPDPVESPHVDLKRLIAASPTAVVGCFVAGLIGSAWWGMGPVYASEIGLTTHQIAGFMTAALVGGLMLQLPIGRLSDRLDRRTVLFWVTVLLSAPVVVLVLGQLLHLWIVMAAATAAYGLASTLYPLSVAYANDYLEPTDVVSASAGFVLFYAAGAVAGPLISSTLMTLTGASGLFIYMLVTVGGLALFIAWRMRVRQWIPVVEKEPYVLQPEAQAPGVVSELDPRAEVDDYYDEGPDTLETHHTPEVPTSRPGPENEESTQGTGQHPIQTATTPGSPERQPAESEPDRPQLDKVKTDL
ncbi:MAG: MFS transporter [Proteobacteria bacterium]|nr:MFS transporter [Pseudomonadota bacterium]MDP6391752.1 MFS transporter [Arenicellales bacterium]